MSSLPSIPAPSAIEREVQTLRTLLKERRFAEAIESGRRLCAEVPQNRDVLYLLAQAERLGQRTADALQTLVQLERYHPHFSRLYQERGHCHVVLKDAAQAIQAYYTAVQINPALPATWGMLEGLYRMTGDARNAATAAAHVATLKTLPAEVIEATALFADGDLAAAERRVRAFLLAHGDHIEAMRLLARIGAKLEVYDDAELLLRGVLERAPDYVAARHDLAAVLLERHKYVEAMAELGRLLAADPGNPVYRTLHASALVGLGRHQEAIDEFRRLIALEPPGVPQVAELHLSVAHSLKTLGRTAESVEEYRAAARARPDFGDAYWSLANLKTYRITDQELARLVDLEAADTTRPVDRCNVCFAIGKAYEDRKDYAASWRYYAQGNALKRAESRYRPELIELNTRNQVRVCTAEFFAARREFGLDSLEPIFVLGLPRSGSTLIEQILASHPAVEGTQELAEVPRYVLELQGREADLDHPRYPDALSALGADDVRRFAERYLADTRVYRSGRPRFIDKMPNNFRHLGFIHLMFPRATIIDARREPMACCFGNLKQLFARGQEFTYSVEDIARYYRTYLELMRHWDTVLPGRVLRVIHEDLVDDLEGNVRRLLEHCGLPFDPACLEYWKTERSVRTASSEQVRRPIYREGLEQWRHYEPWLGPLREALGDALARWRE